MPSLFENGRTRRENTSWLDGIRGLAAIIVAFDHLIMGEINTGFHGFLSEPIEENRWFFQMPPLRIIFGAHAMVPLFMVVSGYAISTSTLQVRNTAGYDKLLRHLSSSVFRRGLRLYIPVLVMSVLAQIALYLNLYHWKEFELLRVSLSSPWEHIKYLTLYMINVIDIINIKTDSGLNPVFWTIPLEFRGSMVVYVCILGLARIRASYRNILLSSIFTWFLYKRYWDIACFMAGLIIAELDVPDRINLDRKPGTEPTTVMEQIFSHRVTSIVIFTIGLSILCLPDTEQFPPGYGLLALLQRPFRIDEADAVHFPWKSIGASLFVYSISKYDALQRPFNIRFVQYLGKISFGVYVVHQMIYRMWRNPIINLILKMGVSYNVSIGITGLFLLPFATKVGEYFVFHVDKRAVLFAKRLEKQLQDGSQ